MELAKRATAVIAILLLLSLHVGAQAPSPESILGEAAIWDGSWKAGKACFQTPEPVTLLLHESRTPVDITVSYEYPQSLLQGEEAAACALLRIPGDKEGLPDTVVTVALESRGVETYARIQAEPVALPMEQSPQGTSNHISQYTVRAAILLMAITAIVLVVIIHWEQRRTRR